MAGFKNFGDFDAVGLAELVRRGETTPAELLDAAMERLQAVDPAINAVPIRHEDFARRQIARGLPDGPFRGVPFALKDLALLEGTETHFGSRAFKAFRAGHSSTLVERHLKAGLTIFGKTNSPEFGLSFTTEPVLHGPTRNPWSLAHSTGGSSGGAAALVAARIVPVAHATDGGGSIRVPAACCGVFGLKPTRGRVPMGPDRLEGWAGMSYAHVVSLSVRDSAAMLDATHGPELGSPYAAPPLERPFAEEATREPGQLRIAFTDRAPDGSPIDREIAAAVRDTAALLERLGHRVEEGAPVTTIDVALASRAIIASATALTLRQRAAELGRTIGSDDIEYVTMAIQAAAGQTSGADYVAATIAIHRLGREFAQFFESVDVFLSPTLCLPPLKLGELDMMNHDLAAYTGLIARYVPGTALFNMSGQPSMSVPLAWSRGGLPLGMMFSARFGDEATLFRLASQLEQERPWRDRKPPVCA
jgi:amidase/6-aminohexanoate-cyclic-dimer hydrolase